MLLNKYVITKDGNVVNSKTGRILKKSLDNYGYEIVSLSNGKTKHTKTVHRLVALEHIPNPKNKPCVNHIDGDKTNNSTDNLEWCTYQENELHSYRVLGKENPKAMLGHIGKLNAVSRPVVQYTKDNKYIRTHESCRQAGVYLSSNYKNIWNAAKGIYQTSAGYKWRFEDELV